MQLDDQVDAIPQQGREDSEGGSRHQPGGSGGQGGICPLLLVGDRTGHEDANDDLSVAAGPGTGLLALRFVADGGAAG